MNKKVPAAHSGLYLQALKDMRQSQGIPGHPRAFQSIPEHLRPSLMLGALISLRVSQGVPGHPRIGARYGLCSERFPGALMP